MTDRYAFIVSDRTGLTAETLGNSLLVHFPTVRFRTVALPFVDSYEKALDAVSQINEAANKLGTRPLIFATLADGVVRDTIASSNGLIFDIFEAFLGPLERELGINSEHSVGSSHGVRDVTKYMNRISALNYTMRTDDGVNTDHYDQASVIILGVSRTGKTPTSLYLALHFGIYAGNYPLTEEDLDRSRLPDRIAQCREKLFGLTIDAERLHQIRQERYSRGRYAQLKQCRLELDQSEAIFRRERIPYVNTTSMSVEEIATTILHRVQLKRDVI